MKKASVSHSLLREKKPAGDFVSPHKILLLSFICCNQKTRSKIVREGKREKENERGKGEREKEREEIEKERKRSFVFEIKKKFIVKISSENRNPSLSYFLIE